MQHDKDSNPTHEVGLRFPDCDVGAHVSRFEKDETVFDCFNDLQVHAMTSEDWMNRGHQAIYTNIFAKTKEYREFDAFSKTVILAMKEGQLEFGYWRAVSRSNSLFTVGCKVCRYFMHCWWRKGADASCLKNVWEAWLMEEPIDVSDEVVPSSEKDGRRDDSLTSCPLYHGCVGAKENVSTSCPL
jgi:hypothetical protein